MRQLVKHLIPTTRNTVS